MVQGEESEIEMSRVSDLLKQKGPVDLNFVKYNDVWKAPTWRLSQLTKDEYNAVVYELAERMKNSLEISLKSRVDQALKMLGEKVIREGDTITIALSLAST